MSQSTARSSDLPRILVIDDDVQIGRLMETVLRAEPYDVTVVDDPEEGLRAHGAAPFDLIILDIFMPAKDGFEVLRCLRGQDYRKAKVLAVSAGGSQHSYEYLDTAIMLGATATLKKPFQPDQLTDAVAACLRARG